MQFISKLLTPKRVEGFLQKAKIPVLAVTFVSLTIGLYLALLGSPMDYQQGHTVRIMYVHVPAAMISMAGYVMMAVASLGYLVWRNPVSFLIARSIAPVGAVFTAICLVSGSVWGKPMWGAWWVWDARLTSVLVMFFLYMGYILLTKTYEQTERMALSASVLSLVGVVNVPIIKMSVEWWNTQHQPASISTIERAFDPAIDAVFLWPLGFMTVAIFGIFAIIVGINVKTELLAKKRLARI